MMKHSDLIRFVVVGLFGVGMLITLAGCGPVEDEATATPSPVPITQAATIVESATQPVNDFATSIVEGTPTVAAMTPTPTSTPIVTPTMPASSDVPLSEDGPWLVFIALDDENFQLWAMNADGSGLTQLTHFTDVGVFRFEVNPTPTSDGMYEIAYTAATLMDYARLYLLRFPAGTSQEITPLTLTTAQSDGLPVTIVPDPPDVYGDQRIRAIGYMEGALRWSPDGKQLAFVGAINGPTSDVYIYTPSTGEIVQLTDGLTHAWNLLWSPDGRYIVHMGNDHFEVSGSLYMVSRAWAVRADGSGITEFPGQGANYVGWLSPDTLLLYAGPNIICSEDLRTVNVDSGIVHYIVPGCFEDVAYDLTNNIALITYSGFPVEEGIEDINIPPEGPGTYVLKDGLFEFLTEDILELYWSSDQQTFYGGGSPWQVNEIFPEEGKLVGLDVPTYSVPKISPDGQYRAWSWSNNGYESVLRYPETEPPIGLWIDTPDGERIQVDTGPESTGAEYVMWASDSQHIFFIDNQIGYIATAPDFIPQQLPISIPYASYWQFEWIP